MTRSIGDTGEIVEPTSQGSPPTDDGSPRPPLAPPPPPAPKSYGWQPPPLAPLPPRTPPPAPPEPPKPRGDKKRRGWVPAAIAIVLVGAVGFGLGTLTRDDDATSSASSTPQTPATSNPAPPTLPTPTGPGASVLAQMIVRQGDLPSSYGVALIDDGNLVAGTVTLDLCNGTFASESLRSGRLQVVAVPAQGTVPLSTEAVLYQDAAATTQAFEELASVAAKCPNTPVRSPSGGSTVTTKFDAAPDGAWPKVATVDRLAYSFTSTDPATGEAVKSIAVYLKRGRALLGLYFPEPSATMPSIGGQTTVPGIVNVFENRLAQLPDSAVN